MKLKLQPYHLAEYRQSAEGIRALSAEERVCRPFRIGANEMLELLDHIEALEEELSNAKEFIASLPPIEWRTEREVRT